jgi:hypothetical protein
VESPSDASDTPALPSDDEFASPLANLAAYVSAADAAGEAVPPEARRMLAQLRAVSGALRALTASLDSPPPAPDAPADAPPDGAHPR